MMKYPLNKDNPTHQRQFNIMTVQDYFQLLFPHEPPLEARFAARWVDWFSVDGVLEFLEEVSKIHRRNKIPSVGKYVTAQLRMQAEQLDSAAE